MCSVSSSSVDRSCPLEDVFLAIKFVVRVNRFTAVETRLLVKVFGQLEEKIESIDYEAQWGCSS